MQNPGSCADTRAPALSLFTSEETPALALRNGGVLIGHLFDRAGIQIVDGAQLPKLDGAAQIRQHILHNCWGEYIVIQPSPDFAITVMNSPSASSGLPCIYSFQAGSGFITSDISLAIHFGLYQRRIDWDYVVQFLTYPYLRTERSALAGISELLPGTMAHFHRSRVAIEQAWTPWDFVTPVNRYVELDEATSSIRNAVSTVVRAFANVDESILLELSGGLDSSIIGTCLRDTAANVACSTLVTPVPGADERAYASLIADNLGAELRIENLSIESSMFSFVDAADPVRPGVGALQYAIDTVMGAAGDALMVNSAFSGGGGDTVFGYLRTAAPAVDAFKERGFCAGLRTIHDLAVLHQCTVWRALQLTLRKRLRKHQPPYQPDASFLVPSMLHENMMDHPWHHAPADALPGDRERIFELAGNQIFIDYSPRRAKRFFRMPLLSQPVVEACLRTPSWMWISEGQNRAVARAAFADRLPAAIVSRRSKGTFMSYLGEVYQHNKGQMLDFLLSGNLRSHGILDPGALERFIGASLPPRDRSFTRILDLCRVENWSRQQG